MNEILDKLRNEYQSTQKSIDDLTNKVREFADEVKGKTEYGEKIANQTKALVDEALTKLHTLQAQSADHAQQLAALEITGAKGQGGRVSLLEFLQNHEDINNLNARFNGSVRIQVSNSVETIKSPEQAAVQTHNMLFPSEAKALKIRDLLSHGQTNSAAVSHLVETGFTNAATAAGNGGARPYSQITTEARVLPVVAIGHLFKTTRESLDDSQAFASLMAARGIGGVSLAEDAQILYGNGSAGQMLGLVKNAVKYTKPAQAASITGIQGLDHIRLAILQVYAAEYPPTGLVISPLGMAQLETLKNKQESYIIGQPLGTETRPLWGLPVVQSAAMKEGYFLVGAFKAGAQLFDRGELEYLISTENDKDFESSLVTIKAERRECLATYRPESFVYGKLDGSTVEG